MVKEEIRDNIRWLAKFEALVVGTFYLLYIAVFKLIINTDLLKCPENIWLSKGPVLENLI